MSRIADTFARCRATGRLGLVAYVTAGDPTLARTPGVLRALEAGGADVIELGVPFSDPLADGPVIQRAVERALAGGATLAGTLDMLAVARASLRAPVVLFTYGNPVFRYGVDRFARDAAAAGVDGVLLLDVPVEEGGDVHASLRAVGLDTILLVSPTTSPARLAVAGRAGGGFLYAISRLGVTGARAALDEGAAALCARIRAVSTTPVALGFGLSRPEHVAAVRGMADAAVVGSALVEVIARHGSSPELEGALTRFVAWLRRDADGKDVDRGEEESRRQADR
jgi:tryptophan synthase alpha chain